MNTIRENRGVTGELKIMFAFPTDDPGKWRMKNGKITYSNGAVAGVDVEGGYVPQFKGKTGLTVTYYVFGAIKTENGRLTGDVTMMTCYDGRVVDASDVAFGVEVVPTPEIAAALASVSQTPSELVPSHS
jgi:uncharacterized protein affecting Mg2+/Co2+ transport